MKEMIPSATGVQALSKTSSSDEIRAYFEAVLNLSKSNEEFPVNLDEVWPLVYERKDYATDALTKDFIQNVDYQVFRQKPENPKGGRPIDDYKLTVSCLEFFIARKVRPVFDVYRQVFHKVATQPQLPQSYAESLRLAADQAEQIERQNLQIEAQTSELKASAPKVQYYDATLSSKGLLTVNMIASVLGISAIKLNNLLCEWGIQYRQSGTYFLYGKYRDKGYAVHKPYPYTDSTTGEIKTKQYLYWTEKGKEMIIKFYNVQKTA